MSEERIKVAVVTGGHPYDVQGFHQLFRSIPGTDAYIQHLDNFAATPDSIGLSVDNDFHPAEARKQYEVILFFSMLGREPTDEGLKWYQGKPKSALMELGERDQGIFLLHHAVLQYGNWPVWDEIVGIENRTVDFKYVMDHKLRVEIANPNHPITQGLQPFDVTEEAYQMPDAGEGSEILLAANDPESMKTLAWTRQYKNARVFCMELGHDKLAWEHPSFRTVVERGIQWCARRI